MDYENLSEPEGAEDNMGGTTQRVFLAPTSYFDSIKKPSATPADLSELVVISDDHEFKDGKGFLKMYCTQDKGKVELKPQGETDGKSFKQEGDFFYPGSRDEAHGFAARVKNDNLILLVEMPDTDPANDDAGNPGYLQVGTELFPAKIDPEFTSGTNSSGVRGYTFKYYAMTPRQYIYKGAVTEMPEGSQS